MAKIEIRGGGCGGEGNIGENWGMSGSIKLCSVAEIVMGQSPPSSSYNENGKGLPFYQGKTDFGAKYPTPRTYCTEPKKLAEAGDILMSVRAPVGTTNLCKEKSCIGRGIAAIQAKNIDRDFLYFYLRKIESYIDNLGSGAIFKAINKSQLSELPINEAGIELPEQKKIAHVLSTVQKAIEEQERIIQTTTELKKALMQKLFTEGLRGEPQKETEIGLVPESWEVLPCEEVCEKITVGIVVKPSSYYVAEGVPAFRSQNVREDRLQFEPIVYISKKANNGLVLKSKLLAGDILMVRTGYPGTSCVVPKEFNECNCIDLIIVRPDALKLQSHFLSRFFNSNAAKLQVLAGKIGLAQQHFNVGAVKRMFIPLPSKSEQSEIVASLEVLDKKRDLAASNSNALQDLFRTLLHELMTAKIRVHDIELPNLN
ncbi:MAG: restriction endonuclease subunit S [Deltaproteobacteria bacterium]|nr:restriction endonuclease subunit S [Deltaproteobacteria bacterium]